jgi:hypothetical protein
MTRLIFNSVVVAALIACGGKVAGPDPDPPTSPAPVPPPTSSAPLPSAPHETDGGDAWGNGQSPDWGGPNEIPGPPKDPPGPHPI